MKRSLVFALLLLLAFSYPVFAADHSGCLICHNSMAGKVVTNGKEIELKVDAKGFQKSVHGIFSCNECHEQFGHDPHSSPTGNVTPAVATLSQKISPKAHIDPVAQASCSKCHDEIYNEVLGSVHGENIVEKGETDGALCLDCHGSPHYITSSSDEDSPANQWSVVETCGNCHGNQELSEKYGIEGNVMKTYMESFHGRKYILGHRRAPTCTHCHGYHAINSRDNPESPVVGTNKIQTCGGCHAGANEKFVSAITHQEAGPIPHYAEKTLIVLTLAVFAFISLHVFLEIYSEIRDYFFRRKEEDHEEFPERIS
jgi:hypothetical protein